MPYPGVISLSVDWSGADRLTLLVAGELSDSTRSALTRTLIRLIERASQPVPSCHTLVVDLANIRMFTPDGVSALRHARHIAHETSIELQLTGLEGRWPLLPRRVAEDLAAIDASSPAPPSAAAPGTT